MCLTMYIYKGTVSQTYRILEFFLFIMAWQRGFWNLFWLTKPLYLFVKHPKHFFKINPAQLIERCPLQQVSPFYMFLLYFYHVTFGGFVFHIVVFIQYLLHSWCEYFVFRMTFLPENRVQLHSAIAWLIAVLYTVDSAGKCKMLKFGRNISSFNKPPRMDTSTVVSVLDMAVWRSALCSVLGIAFCSFAKNRSF